MSDKCIHVYEYLNDGLYGCVRCGEITEEPEAKDGIINLTDESGLYAELMRETYK